MEDCFHGIDAIRCMFYCFATSWTTMTLWLHLEGSATQQHDVGGGLKG